MLTKYWELRTTVTFNKENDTDKSKMYREIDLIPDIDGKLSHKEMLEMVDHLLGGVMTYTLDRHPKLFTRIDDELVCKLPLEDTEKKVHLTTKPALHIPKESTQHVIGARDELIKNISMCNVIGFWDDEGILNVACIIKENRVYYGDALDVFVARIPRCRKSQKELEIGDYVVLPCEPFHSEVCFNINIIEDILW